MINPAAMPSTLPMEPSQEGTGDPAADPHAPTPDGLVAEADRLITRLNAWPAAELEEVQFHEAVAFMRYVGGLLQRARDRIVALDKENEGALQCVKQADGRIAALEAELARLRAPVGDEEVRSLMTKLREIQPGFDGCVTGHNLALKAADLIDKLTSHVEQLPDALPGQCRYCGEYRK